MANKKNAAVKLKTEKKLQNPFEHWSSFEQKGLPVEKQLSIAYEVILQAEDPKQYTLLGALIALKIPRPTFERYLQKYPIIFDAYEHAKMIITRKRFDDAATKTSSERLFNFVPQYCEEYGDYAKWIESIKAAQQNNMQPTNVVVQITDFSKAEIQGEQS